MGLAGLGPWPLRIALALLGSVASSVELAVLLARHYPWGSGLERLYAGLFVGLGWLLVVLTWALLAPDCKRVGWRAGCGLLAFTPCLLLAGTSP